LILEVLAAVYRLTYKIGKSRLWRTTTGLPW
jgi:hypothetical protein